VAGESLAAVRLHGLDARVAARNDPEVRFGHGGN
jgi:hypothetical protein